MDRRCFEKKFHIIFVAFGPALELNRKVPSPPLHACSSSRISQVRKISLRPT